MDFWQRAYGTMFALAILAGVSASLPLPAQNRDAHQNTQDLIATWQGTLGTDQGLRIVMQITKGTQGAYRAVFYSIDRSGDAVPGKAVFTDGPNVKMTFTMIDGTYSGRVSADGRSIIGTWSQDSPPAPLTLTRAAAGSEWTIPPPSVKSTRMDPHADPAFEVATIKPSNPEEQRKGFLLSPDHLQGVNETVDDLITFSYGVHHKQIVDAPAWTESEKFDISAKPDAEGMPNIAQWKTMVKKLLADRFKLSFHRQDKDLAVYLLSTGPTGAKLTESQGDPKGLPGIGFQRRVGDMSAFNVGMADVINFMNRNAGLDRPILDRTGLTGRYDFKLRWTPDDTAAEDANIAPSLSVAFQEQLGLKFSATRALAEVYVIDHVEKPSEN